MSQSGTNITNSGPGGYVQTLTGNDSIAVPPTAGNINVIGANNITVTGNAATSTETINLTGTTQYAVQVGNASGSLSSLSLGSATYVLTSNGAGMNPSFQAPSAGGVTSVTVQAFTTTGTYTPTAGMAYCTIEVVGGGGGGGGAGASSGNNIAVGGGGGGGGYGRKTVAAATIGASKAVTIGAAGTAGANTGGTGGTGGTTSVGAIVTATGGAGGVGTTTTGFFQVAAGGVGGVGGSGDVNSNGGAGNVGINLDFAGQFTGGASGNGGNSFLGGGAESQTSQGSAGNNGTAFGGGGSGGITGPTGAGQLGGTGSAGFVVITEYIG